ncbi:MAG: alanine racemase [Planctomycetaceae bacterium]
MITPAVSFSDVAITENLRRLNELAIEPDRGWAAALTRIVPISVLRELILPVTKLASCSRVHDAEHLAEAGFDKIVFTGRVVESELLRRLKGVADRTQMVVVIDHFRHAELLSQCMVQTCREIQVLIEVDIGRQSTGVRPGPDASLLARATSLLPGLRVIGVFATASCCRAESAVGDSWQNLLRCHDRRACIAEHSRVRC